MAVADVPAEARIGSSISQAWSNIWPHFWWLLLFGVITHLANGIEAGTQASLGPVTVYINTVGALIMVFVGMPLGMGLVKAHLAASRGQKPTWQDLRYAFGPRYWPTIGLGLLRLLIILGGLMLLIVPGIYLAVKLAFADIRFIEDGLGPTDAIKASFADVGGRWWSVFGLALMTIVLVIAGFIALLVGVLVASVLVAQMFVVYWRSLQVERGASMLPEGAAPGPPVTA